MAFESTFTFRRVGVRLVRGHRSAAADDHAHAVDDRPRRAVLGGLREPDAHRATSSSTSGCAFVAMWIAAQIPPQTLMRLAVPAYLVGVAFLVGVYLFGDVVNGAKRWLHVGVTRFQPSEMMKLALPLVLAWYFHKNESALRARDFAMAALLVAIPVAFIAKQPDLGTAALVGAAGFYVIFFAGISWRVLIGLAVLFAVSLFPLWNHAARLPEAPRADADRPDQRPARRRLPHHPVDHRGGLGRHRRQGLAERHPVAPRVHPRAAHRLHLRRVLGGVRPDRQRRAADPLRLPHRPRPDDRLGRGRPSSPA